MSLLTSWLGYDAANKQAKAAKKSGKLQYQASQDTIAEQRRQFDTAVAYLGPQYTDARIASSYYMTALGLYPDTNYKPPPAVTPPAAALTNQQTGPTPKPSPKPSPVTGWPQGGAVTNAAGEAMDGQPQPQPQAGQVTNPDGTTAPAPYTPGMTQSGIVSMVRNSPGFETQLQTGVDAVDSAAIGTSGLMSGRRLMALEAEGQKTFGSFYNQWLDRVGDIAAGAAPIGSQIGQAGQTMANNTGNLLMTGAKAKGDAAVNAASSWAGFNGFLAGQANNFGTALMTGGFGG